MMQQVDLTICERQALTLEQRRKRDLEITLWDIEMRSLLYWTTGMYLDTRYYKDKIIYVKNTEGSVYAVSENFVSQQKDKSD